MYCYDPVGTIELVIFWEAKCVVSFIQSVFFKRSSTVAIYLTIFTGLGIPIPIVAITAGVAHEQYGHDEL